MERLATVIGYDEARLWALINPANTPKLSNGVVKVSGFGSLSEQVILEGIKAIKGDGSKKRESAARKLANKRSRRQKASLDKQAAEIAEALREYPALHGAQWVAEMSEELTCWQPEQVEASTKQKRWAKQATKDKADHKFAKRSVDALRVLAPWFPVFIGLGPGRTYLVEVKTFHWEIRQVR
jgi:hypothetical protein